MRARAAIVLATLLVLFSSLPSATVHAGPSRVFAQVNDEGEDSGEVGSDTGSSSESTSEGDTGADSEGQSDPDAESGAGGDEQAPAVDEAGPPWTYQMAWIVLALLSLLGLGIGLMYWRLVASRQRTA